MGSKKKKQYSGAGRDQNPSLVHSQVQGVQKNPKHKTRTRSNRQIRLPILPGARPSTGSKTGPRSHYWRMSFKESGPTQSRKNLLQNRPADEGERAGVTDQSWLVEMKLREGERGSEPEMVNTGSETVTLIVPFSSTIWKRGSLSRWEELKSGASVANNIQSFFFPSCLQWLEGAQVLSLSSFIFTHLNAPEQRATKHLLL